MIKFWKFISISLFLLFGIVWMLTRNTGENFAIKETQKICKINMRPLYGKEEGVLMEKAEEGSWTINQSFNADPSYVGALINTLNTLSIHYILEEEENQRIRDSLSKSAYVLKVYKTFSFLGLSRKIAEYQYFIDKDIFYMRKGKRGKIFVMNSPNMQLSLSGLFSAKPAFWGAKDLVHWHAHEIKSIEVYYYKDTTASYHLMQDSLGNMYLKDARKAYDSLAVRDIFSSFGALYYEEKLNGSMGEAEKRKSFAFPEEKIRVQAKNPTMDILEMITYPKYEISGKLNPYRSYVILPLKGDTVEMSYFLLDRLRKTKQGFYN